MNDITIVTAWFDFSNSQQAAFRESPEQNIASFSEMAKLENEMVIYTSREYANRLQRIRQELGYAEKTTVVIMDPFPEEKFNDLLAAIQEVQWSEDFYKRLLDHAPQFDSNYFCLHSALKAYFVADAIEKGYVSSDLVAWADFDYMMNDRLVVGKWAGDFPMDKISVFQNSGVEPIDYDNPDKYVYDCIISGGHGAVLGYLFVASRELWKPLADEMLIALEMLLDHNMVDGDQTLLTIVAIKFPDMFNIITEYHIIAFEKQKHWNDE